MATGAGCRSQSDLGRRQAKILRWRWSRAFNMEPRWQGLDGRGKELESDPVCSYEVVGLRERTDGNED